MEPHSAVHMNTFGGKRICGSPLDVGFLDQKRPNLQGECASGFKPCNADSSPDNIVCMPDRLDEELLQKGCPIVDISIVPKSELPDWESIVLHKVYNSDYQKWLDSRDQNEGNDD